MTAAVNVPRARPGVPTGVLICSLLCVLLVAGCGDAGSDGAQASGSPSGPADGSPSGSAAAKPSPSAAPTAVTAADGTRYAACWDGTCEVAVSRPTAISLRFGRLTVSRIQPRDAVAFNLSLPGGGGNGTLKGTCGTIAYFYRDYSGGHGSFCASATAAPQRPAPQPGEVALQLAGWTATGAAVLRLASR
jgi:hypothetical protein